MIICERRLAAGHDVAQSEIEGLDADLVGDDVEQALAREGLRGPRTSVRDVLRLVRDGRAEGEAERFHLVGARQHRLDEPADHGAHAGVRAGVDGHVDLRSRARRPRRSPRASAIMLSSRAWPEAIRCSRRSSIHFTGRPRSRDAAAHGEVLARRADLQTERPADVAAEHAHLVGRDAELPTERHLREVHALVRSMNGQHPGVGIEARRRCRGTPWARSGGGAGRSWRGRRGRPSRTPRRGRRGSRCARSRGRCCPRPRRSAAGSGRGRRRTTRPVADRRSRSRPARRRPPPRTSALSDHEGDRIADEAHLVGARGS